MEVIRSNMLDMVKVLIYATDDRAVWETKDDTDVDLSLQDNEGKSMIHHCVQNRKVRTKSDKGTGYRAVCLASWLGYQGYRCQVSFLHNAKLSDCLLYSWLVRDIMVFIKSTQTKNRPFARSGHTIRNKSCWDANNAVSLPKQRNFYQSSSAILCFGSPTKLFASQHNLFRTM